AANTHGLGSPRLLVTKPLPSTLSVGLGFSPATRSAAIPSATSAAATAMSDRMFHAATVSASRFQPADADSPILPSASMIEGSSNVRALTRIALITGSSGIGGDWIVWQEASNSAHASTSGAAAVSARAILCRRIAALSLNCQQRRMTHFGRPDVMAQLPKGWDFVTFALMALDISARLL